MINYELPYKVDIGEQSFTIRNRGDYRMVLDCFDALNDTELEPNERVACALIIFYEDINSISDFQKFSDLSEAVRQMYKFFNCGQNESPGAQTNYKLIDWNKDSALVSSAINKVAGREIRSESFLHWWTFIGYYTAIGECALSTIVHIRYKMASGKKLEKHERQFKQDNPQYFAWDARTIQQKEADDLAKSLWNGGETINGGN